MLARRLEFAVKSATAGMLTTLGRTDPTVARCVKIKRLDGFILAMTEIEKALTLNVDADGSQTYAGFPGLFPSELESSDDLRPGQFEIETVLDAAGIADADIIARKWQGAAAKYFVTDWANAANGILKQGASYRIGELWRGDYGCRVTLLDAFDLLAVPRAHTVTIPCGAELGDARCGVELTPNVWTASQVVVAGAIRRPTAYNGRRFICTVGGTTGGSEPSWNTTIDGLTTDNTVTWQTKQSFRKNGTVATVTSRSDFTVTGIPSVDAPDNWARFGTCRFTAGLNNNITKEVRAWTGSTGRVLLLEPMPYDIAVNDTIELTIGCDKLMIPTCRDIFNNVTRHRGFHWLPGRAKTFEHV